MVPTSVNVKVTRVNLRERKTETVEEPVATEVPVSIYVNDEHVVTLFALPSQVEELAVGWLLDQGILSSLDEILEIRIKENRVMVWAHENVRMRVRAAGVVKIVDSACGSVEDFTRLLDRVDVPRVDSSYKIEARQILRFIRTLGERAVLYRLTGGTHSAAIFLEEKLVAFSEDVGRHNAVDKVIGIAAKSEVDFSRCVLVSSGRQPADMVLKAARVGIPIVASIAGPIHSGVLAASKTGVTLVCFARGGRMNIYSHPERIEREQSLEN